MFYKDSDGNRYRIGKPFTYQGYAYGTALSNHPKFIELGFTQVIVAPRPDGNYYVVTGPDLDGQYTATPRDLDKLKENQVKKEKQVANQILSETDWMVIRAMDVGVAVAAVPADVSNFRSIMRGVCDARCTAINSTVSVEELETLVKAPVQIYDQETETYITNPDPHLPPWPNEESN